MIGLAHRCLACLVVLLVLAGCSSSAPTSPDTSFSLQFTLDGASVSPASSSAVRLANTDTSACSQPELLVLTGQSSDQLLLQIAICEQGSGRYVLGDVTSSTGLLHYAEKQYFAIGNIYLNWIDAAEISGEFQATFLHESGATITVDGNFAGGVGPS